MGFLEFIRKGVKIGILNRDAAAEVATTPEATGMAVLTFAIAGLAGGVAATVTTGGLGFMSVVIMPIIMVGVYTLMALILHVIAGLMGGKATFAEYYRALGAGAVVLWLMIFPVVGHVSNFWYLAVSVIVTERVHGIGIVRAICTVLIPYLILLGIVAIGTFGAIMALIMAATGSGS